MKYVLKIVGVAGRREADTWEADVSDIPLTPGEHQLFDVPLRAPDGAKRVTITAKVEAL